MPELLRLISHPFHLLPNEQCEQGPLRSVSVTLVHVPDPDREAE